MTLEEIRDLLRFRDAPDENCSDVNSLLDEHIEHAANRIKELELLHKNLRGLRNLRQQTQATKDCGILQSLGSPAKGPIEIVKYSAPEQSLAQDTSMISGTVEPRLDHGVTTMVFRQPTKEKPRPGFKEMRRETPLMQYLSLVR